MDTSPCIEEAVRSAMAFFSSANLEISELDFQSDDRENDYVTESVNLEGDSKSENMITSSRCNTELLENTIEDANNRKKTMTLTMDSVISLIKEVEHREKLAEEAVEKAGRSSMDIFAKLVQVKQARISADETNQKLAKEVYTERDALADEVDVLQISVADLLTMGDSSVGVLDEIRRTLEIRLISALSKKEEAEKVDLNIEASARKALAYEERQMEKVVQESLRLKREAVENSKMREFLTQHVLEVDMLREEITCKCRDVDQLKVKLDQVVVQGDILPSIKHLANSRAKHLASQNQGSKCWGLKLLACCCSVLVATYESKPPYRLITVNKANVMIDKNAFNLEMDNPEDDSTFNNMNTSSAQIYGTQLLDTSIEDVRNQKKTMVLKIDSVTSLMKEVEYQETAAEQTKMEAAQIHSDIMLKVYEVLDMQQHVNNKNDMLSREACVQKKLLSTKMEALQLHVTSLLDKGSRSLELLDEMSRSLDTRLTSAMMEKKLANKRKKGKEAFARAALAYEESHMEKMKEESKRLKQEAVEISKLQEFLIDRGHLVTILHEEISNKCRDVKRLKEELDQVVLPAGKMSFNRKSPISASLSSSLVSPIIPCQPEPGPADSEVLFRKSSGLGIADFIDDHVQSANYKKLKSVIGFSEADIKNLHEVVDVTRSIEKVKTKGELYGYQMKINGKPCAQMFTKRIKKVKIKGKLHEYQRFAKSIKKVRIKGKQHGSQRCAKSSKKSKIKDNQKGSQMCVMCIKKSKIKGKLKGSQMCVMCIEKLKIKGKRKGSQM
ncbi:hypothetical protein SSX86_026875 [Deinandra increscens subsp. villosa]|uniref:Uncharacterized protein n=1 Tax=Deinandra increscens subsp. villosa TaxID=3103831 RepID=A0AAP0CKN7_9ASTR